MKTIILNIRCGEKTCAESKGKFCQYFSTRSFGHDTFCKIFSSFDKNDLLDLKDGWTQRHPDCIKVTEGEEEIHDIGWAVAMLRRGFEVRRPEWRKDAYITLAPAEGDSTLGYCLKNNFLESDFLAQDWELAN